jgi:hypothetical protein
MFAIPDAVSIPFVNDRMQGGSLEANDILDAAADVLLTELAKLAGALAPLRARQPCLRSSRGPEHDPERLSHRDGIVRRVAY